MKKIFRMPTPVKITGRTSSITNAFVNGIIPVIEPTEEEIESALETLGMDKDHIVCAYCGNPYTEWDHFHPLIIVGKDMWEQHWANCQALHDLMQESQKHSDKLKSIIKNTLSQT